MANIAHFLDHPGHHDSRVFRAVEAQKCDGHRVEIFALNRSSEFQTDAPWQYKGMVINPCHFKDEDLIPILSGIAAARKRRHQPNLESPNRQSKKTDDKPMARRETLPAPRLKQVLGQLFWDRAVFKALKRAVLEFNPDIIHAHDLTMLPTGHKIARLTQANLIYDSHEYERSRNLPPPPLTNHIRLSREKRFIKKASAVICVSDSIADQLAQDYRLPRPSVIPNVSTSKLSKSYTRQDFGIPAGTKIVGYFGSTQVGRGLEHAIFALNDIPEWTLLIVGQASESRIADLKAFASNSGVEDRLIIHPPVASSQVVNAMAVCDVTLAPLQRTCLSYEYALPNKAFQSMAANVPILVTPLTEISAFVRYFDAGVVMKGFGSNEIVKAIRDLNIKTITPKIRDLKPYSAETISDNYKLLTSAVVNNGPLPIIPKLPHMA